MLSALGLYHQFEVKFLEASEEFYRAEAQQQLQDLDVLNYMLYVERRLEEVRIYFSRVSLLAC